MAIQDATSLNVRSILDAVGRVRPSRLVLVEGGPHLLADFLEQSCLDELFLTLAPQVAGRNGLERLGLVAGRAFAPHHPVWGTLVDVRRAGSHLFLRYALSGTT
jgi:riboflavin biosynthesis pyrimidine reductase